MEKRRFPLSRLPLIFLLLGACATAPQGPKHASAFPNKVALLPLNNGSLDVSAPELIRNLLDSDLSATSIDTVNTGVMDVKLRQLGITDGGQLRSVTPQKLGEALGAEGLLYGDIDEFKGVNVGVYVNRVIDVRLKLVDAKTGQTLWESQRRKAHTEARVGADAIKTGITSDIFNSPFKESASEVALLLIKDLSKARKSW